MTYPIKTGIKVLSTGSEPPNQTRKLHSYIIINSSGKCQIRQTRKLKLGWTIKEEIGIAYVNRRAISKMSI